MASAIVSPNFEIVIPKEIREAMNIKPGQKVEVFQYEGRLIVIPVLPPEQARGFLRGMDPNMPEELDRI